ncbi:ubiquitin-conjugating enzyme/RWD-like protein [Protomyces lactucae-debilis]|uniref:Ubiquitin-conjugating enzyme/RWD-like protein n=1 Tax=Protomyces lactucae-debilis TaxID=2754530 RepID=A0A1Y2F8Y6_PROLT|nr:ubiquitin-conjugating enzyme/RWD-like protein [Protomyces lactucae-debilis]ORY80370.1 ubiquitin-conjugating enzyme/RWD-like protein [Protomyces lactucae-debilis]
MSVMRMKRLQKELKGLQKQSSQHSFHLLPLSSDNAFDVWHMEMQVLNHPLYAGQIFLLRFKFPLSYPIDSPEVVFLPGPRQSNASVPSTAPTGSQERPIDLDADDKPTAPEPTTYSIPLHPHIYTNGHICLDLLYAPAWSPVQNVESVALSILSMLAGNSIAERPVDDASYSGRTPVGANPKRTNWVFHDDTV